MNKESLHAILKNNKSAFIKAFFEQINLLPASSYRDFVIQTDEGHRRVKFWLNLVIRSLKGEKDLFYEDQKRVGYSRAIQGFTFDFAYQFYNSFQITLNNLLNQKLEKDKIISADLFNEFQELNTTLFRGFTVAAASWMKTREEKTLEKALIIEELYYFSRKIISTFDLSEIVSSVMQKLINLFHVDECYMLLSLEKNKKNFYSFPVNKKQNSMKPILEKSFTSKNAVYKYENGVVNNNIETLRMKRTIALPIFAHDNFYGAIALSNEKEGFEFTQDDLSSFNQFLYLIAIAIENSMMLSNIKNNREELEHLTSRLISIQEEERKRLSFHIHDTLTQELIGISYNIQTCIAKLEKSPQIVSDRLELALNQIDKTIDRTRDLMATLRPDLIDNIGLIPALENHVQNFVNYTGIAIHKNLKKIGKLSSEVEISIFRVAQEALMNIYKHSGAKSATISLYKKRQKIFLQIYDQGTGFNLNNKNIWLKEKGKMGLYSMMERVKSVGGSIEIKTENFAGCRIECIIPLV